MRCASCGFAMPPAMGDLERLLCFYCWAAETEADEMREEYGRLAWLLGQIKEVQRCANDDTEEWQALLSERVRIGTLMRRIADTLQRGMGLNAMRT